MLLERGADPNQRFDGQFHSTSHAQHRPLRQHAVLPRGRRGRRRSAEADDRARRQARSDAAASKRNPRESRAISRSAGAAPIRTPAARAAMVAMTGGRGPAMTGGPALHPRRRGAVPRAGQPEARRRVRAAARRRARTRTRRGPTARTLLHQAARTGNLEMIRALADGQGRLRLRRTTTASPRSTSPKASSRPGGAGRARRRASGRRTRPRARREPAGGREAAARADGAAAGACRAAPAAASLPPPRTRSEEGDLRGGDAVRRCHRVADDAGSARRRRLSRRSRLSPASRRSRQLRSRSPRRSADTPLAYQAMVTRYCVGCHNTRNPLPAGAPLALDTANLADPGADAATWERVVKKLGVGAMPPQGSPTPGAAELTQVPLGARRQPRCRRGEEEQTRAVTSCTA